jgi:hypothetical protein
MNNTPKCSVEISASLALQSWYVAPKHRCARRRITKQGQNLILNMNDKGFNVVAYNRTTSKVDAFLANEAKGSTCVVGPARGGLILLD